MYQPNPPKRKPAPKKTVSSSAKNKADKATYAAESRSSAERNNVGAGRKRMREQNAISAKQKAEYMSKQAGKGRMGVSGGFGKSSGEAAKKAKAAGIYRQTVAKGGFGKTTGEAAKKAEAARVDRLIAGTYRQTTAKGGFGKTTGEAARKASAAAAVKAGKGRMAGSAAIAKAKAQNKKDLQALPSSRTVRENFVSWRKAPIAAAQKAKVQQGQRAKSQITAASKKRAATKVKGYLK